MPSLKDMRGQAKEAGLMKLDKLIAARQRIPDCEIPIPIPELCARYEKLYTGAINDVMREYTLLDQNLPNDIMPLRDEMTVCGEAFTVKSAPNVMIEGEMTFRAQMLDDFKPNGVVVWDTSSDVEASLWGIFGDIDGVLCIPREIAYEVLLRAEGIEKNEVDIFSWVRQGDTISEIIDKGGYF